MQIIKMLTITALTATLAGCIAPKAKMYKGEKAANETTTLVGKMGKRFANKPWFDTFFFNIDGKTLANAMTGEPNEAEVLPGNHDIMIVCRGYGSIAYPKVKLTTAANEVYEFACEHAGNKKVKVIVTNKGSKQDYNRE